jgi:ribosomal protein S4
MLINLLYFKLYLKKIIKFNKTTLYKKILTFKKNKWIHYKLNYNYLLKPSKYKKYNILDHNKNLLHFFANKTSSYSYKYKTFFNFYNKLKHLFVVKKFKNLILNSNLLIKFFETKIDFIILKSKFCFSLKLARQNIINQNILINNRSLKFCLYFIKSGDILKFLCKFNNYKSFVLKSNKWPVPTNIVNYKIKELFFIKNFNLNNLVFFFPFYLKIYNYTCG